MGKGEYKYVSGQIEITESGNERIPEREARGDSYEMLVEKWINEDLNLGNEIVYHPLGRNGRIDFSWDKLNAEFELKNLDLLNPYKWSLSVIKSEIGDRSNAKFKLAIITCKKWGYKGDQYLECEGWRIIETGGIDSEEQRQQAKAKFIDRILDLIIAECELEKSLREYGG